MKKIRGLATSLYVISRITSLLFSIVAIYVLAIVILYQTGMKNLPFEVSNDSFVVFLPFSKTPFLLGDFSRAYLVISISIIILYAIFLWLLSNVFLAFRQPKIFVPRNMKRLKIFYLFNFYVPIIYVVSLILFKQEFRDAILIVFLHLMISVFIFFMATLFRQGLILQEEQDLTF